MRAAVDRELLSPDFMVRLEQLSFVSRKIFAGKLRGERLTKRRGESVEFADFRSYVMGDDLRFLDWNIYARLDKLFIKLFLQEEDLHVSVLLDVSRSMDWGQPNKGHFAKQVAAAIAYIGMVNFDRVSLYLFADRIRDQMSGIRGRRYFPRVVDFLQGTEFDGKSDFPTACKQFGIHHPQQGIVLVLSDMLDKSGYENGFRYLLGRSYDVYVLQILSPEEIDPPLIGDLRLTDVEDDDFAEITAGRALIHRYKQTLQTYCARLKEYCTTRGANYMFTDTKVPFDQVVLNYFRSRGLLK